MHLYVSKRFCYFLSFLLGNLLILIVMIYLSLTWKRKVFKCQTLKSKANIAHLLNERVEGYGRGIVGPSVYQISKFDRVSTSNRVYRFDNRQHWVAELSSIYIHRPLGYHAPMNISMKCFLELRKEERKKTHHLSRQTLLGFLEASPHSPHLHPWSHQEYYPFGLLSFPHIILFYLYYHFSFQYHDR